MFQRYVTPIYYYTKCGHRFQYPRREQVLRWWTKCFSHCASNAWMGVSSWLIWPLSREGPGKKMNQDVVKGIITLQVSPVIGTRVCLLLVRHTCALVAWSWANDQALSAAEIKVMKLGLWWGTPDAVAAVQALPLNRARKAGKLLAEDVAWAARAQESGRRWACSKPGWQGPRKRTSKFYSIVVCCSNMMWIGCFNP